MQQLQFWALEVQTIDLHDDADNEDDISLFACLVAATSSSSSVESEQNMYARSGYLSFDEKIKGYKFQALTAVLVGSTFMMYTV